MTKQTITATITGRGAASTVPDNPGAVDADIYRDGVEIGSVTLIPCGQDGRLGAWGDLDHWADHRTIAALGLAQHPADFVLSIEGVVRAAAEGE